MSHPVPIAASDDFSLVKVDATRIDTIALLERKDYRGEEISMLVMDECQAPPSASAPSQDAATESQVDDVHSTAQTAPEAAARPAATTPHGRASGEST